MTNILKDIESWFKKAAPNPTDDNRRVQLSCHLEEVDEMLQNVILEETRCYSLSDYCYSERLPICGIASDLKSDYIQIKNISDEEKKSFADALGDQVVTLVGLAYMHGINLEAVLQEINRSNWSKFENGEPVFDENGKVKKGKDYTPPDLSKFVGLRNNEQ